MTVKQIILPTGPETRKAFKALGLTLWDESTGQEEHWDRDHKPFMRVHPDRDPSFYQCADRIASAQILQLLGMLPPPPGYVLVPLKAVKGAVQVCDMHVNLAKVVCQLDVSSLVRKTREAMAAIVTHHEQTTTPEQGTED